MECYILSWCPAAADAAGAEEESQRTMAVLEDHQEVQQQQQPQHEVLDTAVAQRAVLVEHVPLAGPDVTEASLRDGFTPYGPLERVTIIQRSSDQQSAMLIFEDAETAVRASASFAGQILGETGVTVSRPLAASAAVATTSTTTSSSSSRPSQQQEEEGQPVAGGGGGDHEAGSVVGVTQSQQQQRACGQQALRLASAGTAVALAESYLLGKKVLHAARCLDEKTGLSHRLKEYDDMNRISTTVKRGAGAIATEARAVDKTYHIREAVQHGVEKALSYPAVARGASTAANVVKGTLAWGQETLQQAKHHVERRTSLSAPSPASPPPPPPPSSSPQQQEEEQQPSSSWLPQAQGLTIPGATDGDGRGPTTTAVATTTAAAAAGGITDQQPTDPPPQVLLPPPPCHGRGQ